MMNFNVFVARRIPSDGLDLLRQQCVRVDLHKEDTPLDPHGLIEASRGRDGILTMTNDPVGVELFDGAPTLRVVSNFGVGFDNVDLAEATRRGIVVTNTPGVLTDAVADLTWALMLTVARHVVHGDRLVRGGKWRGWTPMQFLGADFAGKTLGIVGAGRIGAAVAGRASGFSMRVLRVTSQSPRKEFEQLLRESDFVSVHVPLTPATKHLFGEREFRAMKPTAYFINVARGPVHDEAALLRALRERWIAGAGLDVFENEPRLEPGLAELDNVLLLPHLGSDTADTRERMAIMAANNLLDVLNGRACPNIVNPEALQHVRQS
jgi:glyoxylate reductase